MTVKIMSIGYKAVIKVNTDMKRVLFLFFQHFFVYHIIPNAFHVLFNSPLAFSFVL